MEAELNTSRARLNYLINSSDAIIYSAEVGGSHATNFVSDNVMAMLGFQPQHFDDDPTFWRDHIHPEDAPRVLNTFDNLPEHGNARLDYRLRHQDGSYRWVYHDLKVVRASTALPMEIVGFLTDITERKLMELALEESKTKFQTIFEAAHDMIVLLDRQGNILDVNRRGEQLLGYSKAELCQMNTFQHFYIPEDRPLMRQIIDDLADRQLREYEVRWQAKDGRIIHFAGASAARFSATGEFVSTICALRDMTAQKSAEARLRRYVMRLEALHDIDDAILAARSLNEIAVTVLDRIVRLVDCQQATVARLDFKSRIFTIYSLQARGDQTVAPHDPVPFPKRKEIQDYIFSLRQGNVQLVDEVETFVPSPMVLTAPDKTLHSAIIVPLQVQGELIGTLNLVYSRADWYDSDDIEIARELADSLAIAITQIQQFEEISASREQLKLLASRIVSTQEDERRFIARELHDEIGQSLTALKLNLDMIAQLPSDQVLPRVNEAARLADDLLTQVRNLSLDLRPAMLDYLGLLPTLQSFFERYTSQTNIQVNFNHAQIEGRFAPEIESATYRVVQEALTNVARHAKVDEVAVRLWVDEGKLHVQIEDQGVGFNAKSALASNDTSGLSGMRERVSLLNGQFIVESSPGAGTKLTASLPTQP